MRLWYCKAKNTTDLPIRGCEWKAGEKPAILGGAVGRETYVSIASLVSLCGRSSTGGCRTGLS